MDSWWYRGLEVVVSIYVKVVGDCVICVFVLFVYGCGVLVCVFCALYLYSSASDDARGARRRDAHCDAPSA